MPGGIRAIRNKARDADIERMVVVDRLTVDEVASHFGVSRRTVFRAVTGVGVTPKRDSAPPPTRETSPIDWTCFTSAEFARHAGISHRAAAGFLRRMATRGLVRATGIAAPTHLIYAVTPRRGIGGGGQDDTRRG